MNTTVAVRLFSGLSIATAALLIAADFRPAPPADLTVHEWGTFTSVAGDDGSPVEWDALGGKNDLPKFVNDFGYRGFKWRLTGTVRMETPVIYFYSPRELVAHVKVAFPQGLITEWYPRAEYEVLQKSAAGDSVRRLPTILNGLDTSLRSLTGAIEWRNIKVQPDASPALRVESEPSRYYAARETDAAPLAVGDQQEKFLFYRGVGRFPVPLAASLSDNGTLSVENRSSDLVPAVILFENRGGRLGYRNAGSLRASITLDRPSLDSSLPVLRHDLETALIAQGLYPKEAQAMVETWRDSWFEEGARVIYIVPARSIDAMLPLQVEPLPSSTTRVFVGRIELVTPEAKQSIEQAMAASDWQTAERYGRFLSPILQRIAAESPSKAAQVDRFRQSIQRSISAGAGQ
jgi:hypothetical protein